MKTKIDIVITMGGLGSRFRKMGYTVPKYMINAKGKTLFEWSMISLEGYRKDVNQYIFIAMMDKENDVQAFIDEKCALLGIHNYHVILLDYLTDGQATTAKLASQYWNLDHALLIYNIDTYVEAGEMVLYLVLKVKEIIGALYVLMIVEKLLRLRRRRGYLNIVHLEPIILKRVLCMKNCIMSITASHGNL